MVTYEGLRGEYQNGSEENRVRVCGLDSPDSQKAPVAGSCEEGDELSGAVIGWKCLNQVSDCRVCKLWSASRKRPTRKFSSVRSRVQITF